LAEKTTVFSSKTEVRRLIKEGGLFINKNKITEELVITIDFLINNKYILIQKGKKNYYVIIAQ
jgi:tyrosyl-tRNA synthetase